MSTFFCNRFGKSKQHPTLVTSAKKEERPRGSHSASGHVPGNRGSRHGLSNAVDDTSGHTAGSLLKVSAEKIQATETWIAGWKSFNYWSQN